MDPIAAVAVLRLADSTKRAAFLEGLEGRRARRLKRVAGYPADVAGAWCDPLSPVWPAATPAGDIAEAVRRTADGPHDPLCIIRSDGGFAGCVRITDVMSAGAETPVRRLLQRDLTPILDSTPLADVTGHEGWLDFAQLPVIDLRGRLVGTLSRRRFLTGTGATPPAAAGADGDDIVISATAGAVTSLAIILEAVLSREIRLKFGPNQRNSLDDYCRRTRSCATERQIPCGSIPGKPLSGLETLDAGLVAEFAASCDEELLEPLFERLSSDFAAQVADGLEEERQIQILRRLDPRYGALMLVQLPEEKRKGVAERVATGRRPLPSYHDELPAGICRGADGDPADSVARGYGCGGRAAANSERQASKRGSLLCH